MSVNIDGNINQINTENSWFQNWKNGNSQEKEKDTLQPKAENAVKITFSRDGMESYRKKLQESGKNEENGKVIVKPAALKQASKAIFENYYNCELTKEVEKLSKYKGVKTGFADACKKLEAQGITKQEDFGQKIVTLAQTWKDSYKASASKHNSMEKVLSMMNDMFHINSKAQ